MTNFSISRIKIRFMAASVFLVVGASHPCLYADVAVTPPAADTRPLIFARASEPHMATDLKKKKSPTKSKRKPEDNAASSEPTSAEVRAREEIGLGVRYGNFSGGVSGAGLEAAYVANSAFQIGSQAYYGTLDLKNAVNDTADVTTEKAKATAILALITGRYFLLNSLAVTAGLGGRSLKVDVGFLLNNGDSARGQVEVNSLVANLAIGNYWSWSNGFCLGVDWIGYTMPMYSTYTATSTVSGESSVVADAIQQIMSDFAKELARTASAQSLIAHVGYMF